PAATVSAHAGAELAQIAELAARIDEGAHVTRQMLLDEGRRCFDLPFGGLAGESEAAIEVGDAEADEADRGVGADDLDAAAPGVDDVAVGAAIKSRADEGGLGLVAQGLVAPAHAGAGIGD